MFELKSFKEDYELLFLKFLIVDFQLVIHQYSIFYVWIMNLNKHL